LAAFFAGDLAAFFAAGSAGLLADCADLAVLAGAFFAAAFLAVLALTVERPLEAAATLRELDSSAERTTVTPSSLRNLSRALRCLPEIAAASLVSRTASELTCPSALPRSTRATTSG
jgi:hypothetical protein